MAGVIDLELWRQERVEEAPGQARLEEAVDRLDRLLTEQHWREPPAWLVTELLAVQGCISMGLTREAASRTERLIERTERMVERLSRAPAR